MEGHISASFEWYDYLIFSLTLAVSLGVGFYFATCGGKQKTLNEYLLANRKMAAFPSGASIALSIVSAILILGSTAEVFVHGLQMSITQMTINLGMLTACFFYVPMFYRLGITSLFEVRKIFFALKRWCILTIYLLFSYFRFYFCQFLAQCSFFFFTFLSPFYFLFPSFFSMFSIIRGCIGMVITDSRYRSCNYPLYHLFGYVSRWFISVLFPTVSIKAG